MKIVVLVKYVPDAQGDRHFTEPGFTTERTGVEGLLSELDEYPIEEALKLKESGSGEPTSSQDNNGHVTVMTMGPAKAADALKKALQMGADEAVHIRDEGLVGSDAPATARVLAAAITKVGAELGPVDVVLLGMASTDGVMGVLPAMLAQRLGLPQLTYASELTITGDRVRIRRDGDVATQIVEAALPAVISVTDQINEPRYPSFKGIMAAKKKPVHVWSLAQLGIDPAEVGLQAAWTQVVRVTPRPPRQAGLIVTDDGPGGEVLARYLELTRLI